MEKLNKYTNIVKKLDFNRELYYNTGRSEITDYEYDKLLDEAKALEKELGVILSNSPTVAVGFKAQNKLPKIQHEHLMLSLDKCHSIKEIQDFVNNKETLAMLKLDGLTVSATYVNGMLTRLETRGDGQEGNDIMLHASSFSHLPMQINKTGKYVVDGEAIISYRDFNKINNKLPEKEKYHNARNLAAGTLNLLNSKESSKRHLQFIVWDVIEGGTSSELNTNLLEADKLGFTIVPNTMLHKDINTETIVNGLKDKANDLEYPIDGIVIKYTDIDYGKSLGSTSHHFNNAIAYKFEDQLYKTVIKDIEWGMGKTGILTPVAVFDPIMIDGTIVEKASMHNISIYNELDVIKGDEVLVYKANQIIPQIHINLSAENRRLTKDSAYQIYPGTCPVCGGVVEINQTNDTKVLMCTNMNCKGKLLGKLKHFVSKSGVNIEGLSEATLEKFIEKGWLTKLSDVYYLGQYKTEMQRMEGFGIRSVNKLMDAIENSKKVTMDKFLCALSIPGIGRSQSKEIASNFKYVWFDFEQAILDNYDFTQIEGIGKVLHNNIYNWYDNCFISDGIGTLTVLMHFIINTKTEKGVEKSLEGKVFVITGSLNEYSSRSELKDELEALGAKVSGSISKKTSFLINNDANSASSKNKKAKELGIPVLTENEFKNMFLN